MFLSEEQTQRYSRNILLPEVGAKGQVRLLEARVLIVGAGGLGCPIGYYLVAAGVGTIGLVDNDNVEISNLQRQIAHNSRSLGIAKVDSAKATFQALNPDVDIHAIKERVTHENIMELLSGYDIIVDGSDNFPTRYLVNDACVALHKPLVSGAIHRFEGQVTTILPGDGHCYRCLFEEMPPPGLIPSCQDAGIMGAISGVIGSLQSVEVIKLILGKGTVLKNKLLIYDALKASFRHLNVPTNPECPACGERPEIFEPAAWSAVYCNV